MINLKRQTVNYDGREIKILRWEVWFMTPLGLHKHLETATKHIESIDMLPDLTISPIPVAICEDNRYEPFIRT